MVQACLKKRAASRPHDPQTHPEVLPFHMQRFWDGHSFDNSALIRVCRGAVNQQGVSPAPRRCFGEVLGLGLRQATEPVQEHRRG